MSAKQITDTILMVRPASFAYNPETAESNTFQQNDLSLSPTEVQQRAIREFDEFVQQLRDMDIRVVVAQDSPQPVKSDAVFPNNWVTFHEDGTVVTYPMNSPVRRLERQDSFIQQLGTEFQVGKRIHFEQYEAEDKFLEGTGSMILDRPNKVVYACLSPRTDESLLDEFCEKLGYEKIAFTATNEKGIQIYHTNVMMALGETFVVVCMESVRAPEQRQKLRRKFIETDKEVIEISYKQMNAFAGNMLQVKNTEGNPYLVMSQQAFNSLDDEQLERIMKHTDVLYSPIPTIEKYGGGSARCMMAEVFLPKILSS